MSEYTPEQFIEMREACIGDGFSIHSMIYKMLTVAATNCERLAECKHWLKDGQTPAERLEANHKESIALLGLLKKEKQRVEILEAAAIWITANALPASIQTAISNLEDAAKEKARYKPPHSQDEDPKIYDAELEGFRTNLEDAIAAYINSALEQANAALKSHKERMEAKPVAWMKEITIGSHSTVYEFSPAPMPPNEGFVPLYLSPPSYDTGMKDGLRKAGEICDEVDKKLWSEDKSGMDSIHVDVANDYIEKCRNAILAEIKEIEKCSD